MSVKANVCYDTDEGVCCTWSLLTWWKWVKGFVTWWKTWSNDRHRNKKKTSAVFLSPIFRSTLLRKAALCVPVVYLKSAHVPLGSESVLYQHLAKPVQLQMKRVTLEKTLRIILKAVSWQEWASISQCTLPSNSRFLWNEHKHPLPVLDVNASFSITTTSESPAKPKQVTVHPVWGRCSTSKSRLYWDYVDLQKQDCQC